MDRSASRRSPGRPRASEPGKVDTRSALLEAGVRIFSAHGYRGATVDAIIAAAGLSKGTFYWNYSSKRELFEAVIEERVDRPIREFAQLISAASADRDAAVEASRAFAEVLERERETIVLNAEYWALAVRDPGLRRRYARRHANLRDALAAALEQRARTLGAPPFEPPATEIATAFLALSAGLSRIKLVAPEAVSEGLFGEVLALVYAGLVAKSGAGDGGDPKADR